MALADVALTRALTVITCSAPYLDEMSFDTFPPARPLPDLKGPLKVDPEDGALLPRPRSLLRIRRRPAALPMLVKGRLRAWTSTHKGELQTIVVNAVQFS